MISQYKIRRIVSKYKRGKAQTPNQVSKVLLVVVVLVVIVAIAVVTRADPRAE